MKKIFLLLVFLLNIFNLVGCSNNTEKIKVLVPEGIPAVALGNIVNDEKYDLTLVNGSMVLSSELMKEDYDIIIAPVIMGAQLYSKNSLNYKLNTIITEGNMYLISKVEKQVNTLNDLIDKKIALFGQNTAPDILFKSALSVQQIEVDRLNLVYENSVSDVVANRVLIDNTVDAFLCSEPLISKLEITLKNKVGNITIIDLQEVLKDELELIPQAGIFIKKSTEKNEQINEFIERIKRNVDALKSNKINYVEDLFKENKTNSYVFKNIGKEVLINSIERSNICFKNAKEYKGELDKYFSLIRKYNNKLIEENISEDFY